MIYAHDYRLAFLCELRQESSRTDIFQRKNKMRYVNSRVSTLYFQW